ncbi:MAG: DUF4914 family protein [Fibrobacteria bacterium]|nr:DUF4914 family protein [Fibrobacteria bacterium]
MDKETILDKITLPAELRQVVENCPSITLANTIDEISDLCVVNPVEGYHVVSYDVPGQGEVKEAYVCKTKNGICANYYEPYMRRREPESMLIGDNMPTDKIRYENVFEKPFDDLRTATFEWLKNQPLIAFVFRSGQIDAGIPSLAIAPANAGFFALALAQLQGIIDLSQSDTTFSPVCFLYTAPPFRHSHFNGKQYVVHNRLESAYEVFSYNLYPGPSAKKGIFGALLHFGEIEKWVTAHAAAVQVVTPYGNKTTFMHEGASGGGKSEMNEHIHRESDGSILFGQNTVSGKKKEITLPKNCFLKPVTDDMALCHPSLQKDNGKLTIVDAEHAWFIRVDHIKNYGTDPDVESCSIHPEKPLLFLNIDGRPGSTALLWEHIEDAPGKACSNPRFIFPREIVPNLVNNPVSIDIRSFGVRTPPCTAQDPSYGVLGLFHILTPALAWLWRLVSPRGYANPSIVSSDGMQSEGVGSFWPFATGKKVNFANLLLEQIQNTPNTHYLLFPVKHIGAWKVGFMPQWIAREYLARRGGVRFMPKEITPSLCPLLGYSLNKLVIEGQFFDTPFFQVDKQPEVGTEAFLTGAKQLETFFKEELKQYKVKELNPVGKAIIECFLNGGSPSEYEKLIPGAEIVFDD